VKIVIAVVVSLSTFFSNTWLFPQEKTLVVEIYYVSGGTLNLTYSLLKNILR